MRQLPGGGERNGHQLVNRSNQPVRYLEISNRDPEDGAEYPDVDLVYRKTSDGKLASLEKMELVTNHEYANHTRTFRDNESLWSHTMLLTNIETVPGKAVVEHYGLVQGSSIRAKHVGRDFMAGLKNIVGGELKGYTELLEESREQAIRRMVSQAKELGANAILNVRLSTSAVAPGAAEILCYGTAVLVE